MLSTLLGFQHVSPIDDFPDEKWHDLIEVLLSAPFRLIKVSKISLYSCLCI